MAFGVVASVGAPILMAYYLLTRESNPAKVFGGSAGGFDPDVGDFQLPAVTLPDPQTPVELALYVGGGAALFLLYGAVVLLVMYRLFGTEDLLYR